MEDWSLFLFLFLCPPVFLCFFLPLPLETGLKGSMTRRRAKHNAINQHAQKDGLLCSSRAPPGPRRSTPKKKQEDDIATKLGSAAGRGKGFFLSIYTRHDERERERERDGTTQISFEQSPGRQGKERKDKYGGLRTYVLKRSRDTQKPDDGNGRPRQHRNKGAISP